jgi:hypothetical protein
MQIYKGCSKKQKIGLYKRGESDYTKIKVKVCP